MIEAVAGIIIALIIIIAFTTLISKAIVFNSINGKQLKAVLYLQEMVEIAKDLEQSPDGWDRLTTTTSPCYFVCYPEISGSSWIVSSGTEELENNIYERSMMIENVCRDSDNNISDCMTGTDDPYTKKVIAQIEWNDQLVSRNLEIEAYVYNYNP